MRRNQVNSERTNLSGELDLPFLKKLFLANFKLSRYEIYKVKDKTRGRKEAEWRMIIDKFNNMIARQELPADESFSRVIAALKKLGEIEQALELFALISEKANPKLKDQIIGAYTLTAVLEIYRKQIKNKDDNGTKAIVDKAEQLWELCKEKKYLDGYLITDMMCMYASVGQYEKVVALFSTYEKSADLPMYSQYILSLLKMDNLELAHLELNKMKEFYAKIKNKKHQDEDALYCIYNTFIIKYFDNLKNPEQALQIFRDAINFGFYQNNQLQCQDDIIKLDFHWDKNYKEKEGGLPLVVAKVAFLYFMQQVAQEEIHISALIVTGGHIEQQSKLKKEFPDYLHDEYGVEIKWHENPRVLAFTIPYAEIRKIRFINDVLSYFDSQTEHFDNVYIPQDIIDRYRADLRRNNEGRINKHSSEKPVIPKEFDEKALSLANAGMKSFEKGKYEQAKQHYNNLIKYVPNHPWPYVQLGWVLHRTEDLDAAIVEYQKTIDLIQKNNDPNQRELLSETYRKMGWVYDRKHRNSKSASDLETAFNYYQKAIDINPNNIETYNNRGIGLARIKKFKDAIKNFKIVKDNIPEHDEACVHLGNCHKQLTEYEQAKDYYQQAITRSQIYDKEISSAWTYCELGDLYSRQFKNDLSNESFFDLARNAFETSLKLQPNRDQAFYGLADLYKLKGDMEKSKEYMTKAHRFLPDKENLSSFAQISTKIRSSAPLSEIQSKEAASRESPQLKSESQKDEIKQENKFDEDRTNQHTFG